jgi:hypothetical protein
LNAHPSVSATRNTTTLATCEGTWDEYYWDNCLCDINLSSVNVTFQPIPFCGGCAYTASAIVTCQGVVLPLAATGSMDCGDETRVVIPCYGQAGVKIVTFFLECSSC